jgi:peroxiredoxin
VKTTHIAALAVTLATLSCPALAAVKTGDRSPGFTLANLSGGKVTLAQYQGKVVLLDFWAQWCEPCKQELPKLQQLANEYGAKGVVVLTVNIDTDKSNAERLAKELKLTLPIALDPSGSVAGTYDLPKMPSSFVIDKGGIVRAVHNGYEGDKDVDRFRQELNQLTK